MFELESMYVSCNEDKLGYVIAIVDNNYEKIREAAETRRIDLLYVRKDRLCVVPLVGIQPSINCSIHWPPSPPKGEKI